MAEKMMKTMIPASPGSDSASATVPKVSQAATTETALSSPSSPSSSSSSSWGLSALAQQLRALQTENTEQSMEIDRLQKQVTLLADLQGISVSELQGQLKRAMELEAVQEWKRRAVSLESQVDYLQNLLRKQRQQQQDGTCSSSSITNQQQQQQQESLEEKNQAHWQLRVGELEEVEATLRKELDGVYASLSQKTAALARAEQQQLQQQQQQQQELALRKEMQTLQQQIKEQQRMIDEQQRINNELQQQLQQDRDAESVPHGGSSGSFSDADESPVEKIQQRLRLLRQQEEDRSGSGSFSQAESGEDKTTKEENAFFGSQDDDDDMITAAASEVAATISSITMALKQQGSSSTSSEKTVPPRQQEQVEPANDDEEEERDEQDHHLLPSDSNQENHHENHKQEENGTDPHHQTGSETETSTAVTTSSTTTATVANNAAAVEDPERTAAGVSHEKSIQVQKSLLDDDDDNDDDDNDNDDDEDNGNNKNDDKDDNDDKDKDDDTSTDSVMARAQWPIVKRQLESLQKSSQLRKEQFEARFRMQNERITDLEQQLASLYMAYQFVEQEQSQQEAAKSDLQNNLNSADAMIARQLNSSPPRSGDGGARALSLADLSATTNSSPMGVARIVGGPVVENNNNHHHHHHASPRRMGVTRSGALASYSGVRGSGGHRSKSTNSSSHRGQSFSRSNSNSSSSSSTPRSSRFSLLRPSKATTVVSIYRGGSENPRSNGIETSSPLSPAAAATRMPTTPQPGAADSGNGSRGQQTSIKAGDAIFSRPLLRRTQTFQRWKRTYGTLYRTLTCYYLLLTDSSPTSASSSAAALATGKSYPLHLYQSQIVINVSSVTNQSYAFLIHVDQTDPNGTVLILAAQNQDDYEAWTRALSEALPPVPTTTREEERPTLDVESAAQYDGPSNTPSTEQQRTVLPNASSWAADEMQEDADLELALQASLREVDHVADEADDTTLAVASEEPTIAREESRHQPVNTTSAVASREPTIASEEPRHEPAPASDTGIPTKPWFLYQQTTVGKTS